MEAVRAPLWMAVFGGLFMAIAGSDDAGATQVDIAGPPGSAAFGRSVTALPNGNFVVTDPYGPVSAVGAVYLYAANGTLISALVGSSLNDNVGSGGITVLSNGNFVVMSPNWNNAGAAAAGAATWVDGTTGLNGAVSAANSLVGSQAGDFVGNHVVALDNGNYAVGSSFWHNGTAASAGAVTFGNGTSGRSGVVSAANSLVGSSDNDAVGSDAIRPLGNGRYIVASPTWDRGFIVDAGAVTWCDGQGGPVGPITASNSLVGETDRDYVGGVTAVLANHHYVVGTPNWDNLGDANVGAATWADGNSGRVGQISTANSLIGGHPNDRVGAGLFALTNGHYVVASPSWSNGSSTSVGAVTWANGTAITSAVVGVDNSLVGSHTNDSVGLDGGGYSGVYALPNGNYVVRSSEWNSNTATRAGAVTWRSGGGAQGDTVSALNSLTGSHTDDHVGNNGIAVLANGNYVVASPYWSDGVNLGVGAATFGGSSGVSGLVSASNSLVGSSASDNVGYDIVVLSDGNYQVLSFGWDSPTAANVGAITFGNGTTGRIGTVTAGNSLIGATPNDSVGARHGAALAGGNYVALTPGWDAVGGSNVGAATLIPSGGLVGYVQASNSLTGRLQSDTLGRNGITAVAAERFVIASPDLGNNGLNAAGGITLGRLEYGTEGRISSFNTVFGNVAGTGNGLTWSYDSSNDRLIVGRPSENIVSLLTVPPIPLFKDSFE